jgi:hypothetical protein
MKLENKDFFDKLYENEAEEGSDNEEHDDIVKLIDRKKEMLEEGFGEEEDLN